MVEEKLKALNLSLPEPLKSTPDMKMPPSWIRVRGNRAFISGHGPQNPNGPIADPFGKVGSNDVALEQAYQAARLATLRSEEHTSELQSRQYLVCRLLLEKKKDTISSFT